MRAKIVFTVLFISAGLAQAQQAGAGNGKNGIGLVAGINSSTKQVQENYIEVMQKQETWDKEARFKTRSGKDVKTIRTERKVHKAGDNWRAEGFELKETAGQDFILIDRYTVDYDYDVSTSYGLAPTFGRDTSSQGEYWE